MVLEVLLSFLCLLPFCSVEYKRDLNEFAQAYLDPFN